MGKRGILPSESSKISLRINEGREEEKEI